MQKAYLKKAKLEPKTINALYEMYLQIYPWKADSKKP